MPVGDILFFATIAFMFATVIGVVGWALSGDLPRRIVSSAASGISTATVGSSSAYRVRGTEPLAAALHLTDQPQAILISAILALPPLAQNVYLFGSLSVKFIDAPNRYSIGVSAVTNSPLLSWKTPVEPIHLKSPL
jgi:hypothetical protein